ncbi:MAG: BNR-4 repeat-containing protein [Paludibacter sp.]|nr:BNR-4 repeat-containing protein [Paludibacter sp.]
MLFVTEKENLPDERIMIFYSRHTDEACFYYRVSKKAGDITSLGEEMKIITAHNTTYPSPFVMSDDPAHIYLCWRGINWHPTIAKLTLPDAQDKVSIVRSLYIRVGA